MRPAAEAGPATNGDGDGAVKNGRSRPFFIREPARCGAGFEEPVPWKSIAIPTPGERIEAWRHESKG